MNPLKQLAPQIDPITGIAIQPGQIQPNPMINPRALGGMQPQIPGMFPGSAFQSKEHPGKDGHTGHVKDPKGGEVVKVYDDSKPKRKIKDKETPKQKKNRKAANLLNARSSKELNK